MKGPRETKYVQNHAVSNIETICDKCAVWFVLIPLIVFFLLYLHSLCSYCPKLTLYMLVGTSQVIVLTAYIDCRLTLNSKRDWFRAHDFVVHRKWEYRCDTSLTHYCMVSIYAAAKKGYKNYPFEHCNQLAATLWIKKTYNNTYQWISENI